MAGTEYIDRHNAVVKIIHQQLALKYSLNNAEEVPHFKYNPDAVMENAGDRLYWDRTILTAQWNTIEAKQQQLENKIPKENK